MGDPKHIQIKLKPDEYNVLDDKARDARMKITPYAHDLFLSALHGKEEISVLSRAPCKMLDNILRQGSEAQRECIIGVLEIFDAVIKTKH
jgi:hypothetical protein